MKKSAKVTTVPVKLARRCGLEGFSTAAGGGYFSTSLGGLMDHFPSARAECLWLTGHGLEGAEPAWLAHHYPEMGW